MHVHLPKPLHGWRAFVGEVALTGAVRPVPGMDLRLAAAGAAGIKRVVRPSGGGPTGLVAARSDASGDHAPELVLVGTVRDALNWAFGPRV